MSALSIEVPFPVFQDRDGQPLENGYVWLGVANLNPQTNPVIAYFDKALTIPAAQPLRTINGYISNAGTPSQVYVDGANFSILVQDSKGSMVYNFPDGTGIDPNACGVIYNPPFTGAVATPVCVKLAETISVKDFGAVGDNVTDDTAAIQAAIDYVNLNGEAELLFPSGNYIITSTLIINPLGADTIVRNIRLVGAGGDLAGGTGLRYLGNVGGLLKVNSPLFFSCEDISFRNDVSGLDYVVLIDAGNEPQQTGRNVYFKRCTFLGEFNLIDTAQADVWVINQKTVLFEQCRWAGVSGSGTALRIGDNASSNVNKFFSGACINTDVRSCVFNKGIDIRNAGATTITATHFDNPGAVAGTPAKIFSTGDKLMGGVTVDGCTFLATASRPGHGSYTPIVQGDGDETVGPAAIDAFSVPAMSIRNCLFRDASVAVQVTKGHSNFTANQFTRRSAGGIGIQIDAGVGNVNVQTDNNFESVVAEGGTPILDNRTLPFAPVIVAESLAAFITLVPEVNTVIFQVPNVKFRGGLIRVNFAITLTVNDTNLYRARLTVDGIDVLNTTLLRTLTSGDTDVLQLERILPQIAAPSGAIVRLQVRQFGSGSGSVVKEDSPSTGVTFLQIEELD